MNTVTDTSSIQYSYETISGGTTQSLSNFRTNLSSSSSISLPGELHSVHEDPATDSWLVDFESRLSSEAIYDEFDSIPHCRFSGTNEEGRQLENALRNRYADVIPYDDTRVRLARTRDNPSGYINASHVKFGIETTMYSYIATELPLCSTMGDFWRMVFDYNVHVLVMLLGDDEIQLQTSYFPRTKHETCRTDAFEIKLVSEQNQSDFALRQLSLKELYSNRTRSVIHLQYKNWNNKQLPLETTSFINFIHLAHTFRRHLGDTYPYLVHCTAGIGRTGMFILLHIMIQCITFNKKIGVANVLKVMREYRMSFVDRTHFYLFVYRCLIDYLKSSRLI